MRFVRFAIALFALSIAALPGSALAQISTADVDLREPQDANTWATISYAYLFETDVDGNIPGTSDVEMERDALLAAAGHRFELSDSVDLMTQVAYQLSSYNFNGDNNILWDDVNQVTLSMLFSWDLNERWSLLGGGLVRFSGESDADFEDSLTSGGFAGFQYRWNENLETGLLLGAMTEIEDSASVLPLPLVDWKFAKSWEFRLGVSQLGAVGYGPELTWYMSDEFDLALGASYQRRRFRMDQGGLVGEETSMPIYLKLGWHPTPQSVIELMAGAAVAGEIRQETVNGTKIFDHDTDPSAIVSLRGHIRF
jgi:hypothetical protein